MFWPSCLCWPLHPDLSGWSVHTACLDCPIPVVLLWLSCYGFPVPAVLSCHVPALLFPALRFPLLSPLSYPCCYVLTSCPSYLVMDALSQLSCPCCHVLASLSSLFWPGWPVLPILPWLSCHGCPVPDVLTQRFWSWCHVLAIISSVSGSGCSVPSDQSAVFRICIRLIQIQIQHKISLWIQIQDPDLLKIECIF
jgi:hypothetical protein